MSNKEHIITLGKEVFINGDEFFTLKEAQEQILWFEEKYPNNKGDYKIFSLVEVIWR